MIRTLSYLGLCAVLYLASTQTAIASESCAANFKHAGDQRSGLHFETYESRPGLDARSVIAQLKKIAVDDDFQLGDETYVGTSGTLVILQGETANARGFPINIVANAQAGTTSIATDLPVGMNARPATVLGAMCGMLARVDWDSKSVPTMDAAAAQATPPGKVSPARAPAAVADACEAHFQSTLDASLGRNYTTWVSLPGLSADVAAGRMKQIAEAVDFAVDPEDRHGTETDLTVYQKTSAKFRGFPIHFGIDEALGTISVVTRVDSEQNLDGDSLRGLMCLMVAGMTDTPAKAMEKARKRGFSFKNPFVSAWSRMEKQQREKESKLRQQQEDWNRSIDELLHHALASGKSVVVMPGMNLNRKYTADQAAADRWAYYADETATTIWQGKDDPGNQFKVGHGDLVEQTGLHGALLNFVEGGSHYLVYIVSPDTYTISGNTFEAGKADMPQLGATRKNGSSGLGQVFLMPKKNTEYYKTQEWFNAQYSDRTVHEDYCSAVHVASGTCVSWNASEYSVKDLTSPAGWRDITKARSIDGMAVSTRLKQDFASFKVAPGEAILVDGFSAEPPNAEFDHDACQAPDGSRLQCDLTRISMTRVSAHLKDIQSFDAAGRGYPNAARIFATLKYQPVNVAARPGSFHSVFGQNYSLEVPR